MHSQISEPGVTRMLLGSHSNRNSFAPTAEAIEQAAAVVQANEEHQKHGQGAFSFEGKMIDMPTVKQFKNLLYRAELMGLYKREM